jgi:D-glycero-alpha-D-manno-heptose-7-phosphate kinase
MLLYVPPAAQERVRSRLSGLLHVPFHFEPSGSQILFYEPEEDYSQDERIRDAQALEPFTEARNL